METFSFSKALNLLMEGKKVTRLAWEDKIQFIYRDFYTVTSAFETKIKARLMRKTASGNVTPWIDLLEDLMATDWVEVTHTCIDKLGKTEGER